LIHKGTGFANRDKNNSNRKIPMYTYKPNNYLNTITILFFIFLSQIYAGTVSLTWDVVTNDINGDPETGIIYYQVYGQSFPGFPVDVSSFIGATTNTSFTHRDTLFDDPNAHYFYRIIATDEWGNKSEITNVKGTTTFVLANVKIFLEGVYDADGDTMRTTLHERSSIPLSSPYTSAPRTVSAIPNDVVDWICLELRQESTGSAIASYSFFLKKDGAIVEIDGSTADIGILGITDDDYFILLRFRNHIAVMSKNQITLSNSASLYDFGIGSEQFFGENGALDLGDGTWGMWAGDIDGDGEVTTSDYTQWYNSARAGDSGYHNTDINLDGEVTTSDYTKWYNCARRGASSTVP
jgi:hypothetical protein